MKQVKHFYILLGMAILIIAVLLAVGGLGLWANSKIVCPKLAEAECQKRSDCQPIYGDGFKECVKLSDVALAKISENQILCRQTGGEWKRTKFGDYCNCASVYPPLVFEPAKGCVSK